MTGPEVLDVALAARVREALGRPPAADSHRPGSCRESRFQRAGALQAGRGHGLRRLAAASGRAGSRNHRCNGDGESARSVPFPARELLQFLCSRAPDAAPCSHRLAGNGLP